ncbi:MAG: hypothetical protein MZW92_41030 [Comamonadaceae bacterium]|nr:hypothetical protein [Comamonadaceae bacterium]
MTPVGNTPAEFAQADRTEELERWAEVVMSRNLARPTDPGRAGACPHARRPAGRSRTRRRSCTSAR